MTTESAGSRTRLRLAPMRPRDPSEPGRSASTLELFFDLVFVVAVSIASVQLHESLTEAHVVDGLVSYALIFFAIWWAWMNFTWFATSFGTDDWLYRLLTIVQMAGVLILAAGIQPLFADGDFTLAVAGYVVMRVGLVAQWIRASISNPDLRRTTLTYAVGVTVMQILWIATLPLEGAARYVVVPLLVAGEISVPVIAERQRALPWHPHHITERYGLFTLILLGESLLGSSNAIIEGLRGEHDLVQLVSVAVLTLVSTAALWWIYFWPPHHESIGSLGRSVRYGYTHYFVFAAAGALSAGIEVELDVINGDSKLSDVAAAFTFTVPVAVFILGIWWIAMCDYADRFTNIVIPAGAALILLDPIVPLPFAITSVVLVVMVVVLVVHPTVQRGQGEGDRPLVQYEREQRGLNE